ncbi:MAG: hypothetical protein WA718_21230 [Terriglobales bacterium]
MLRTMVPNTVSNILRTSAQRLSALCRAALGVTDRCVRRHAFLAGLLLLGALVACSKPAPTPTEETARKETGLEALPMPDPAKYPALSKMSGWQNPYLVVREDGIGFVDLSNREVHILKVEEIPAELVSLPSSAWPYGRVVLVAQAVPKDPSEQTKAQLRKNRALLLGTLKELDVQYREAP